MKAQTQPTQSQSSLVRRSSDRPNPIKDQSFEDLYISAEHAIDALERSVESARSVFVWKVGYEERAPYVSPTPIDLESARDTLAAMERDRAASEHPIVRAQYDRDIATLRADIARVERDRSIDASEARIVAHTQWRAQEHDDSIPPSNVVSREDLARLTSAFRTARARTNTAWNSYHPYDHIPIAW